MPALQVSFVKAATIRRIYTQGRQSPTLNQYVTQFTVYASMDDAAFWPVLDKDGQAIVSCICYFSILNPS
jgi:hypothetical protein